MYQILNEANAIVEIDNEYFLSKDQLERQGFTVQLRTDNIMYVWLPERSADNGVRFDEADLPETFTHHCISWYEGDKLYVFEPERYYTMYSGQTLVLEGGWGEP